MATNIKPISPALRWLVDMISMFAGRGIALSKDPRQRVLDVKSALENDVSGIANSLLDFAINTALVNYYVETENDKLNVLLNNFIENVNESLRGKIPVGINSLAKEYFRERWKGSSFILLRSIWENKDGYNVPTKLWFVDGEDIHIKENDSETITLGDENYELRIAKNKYLSLPQNKNELLFVQKPFSSWGTEYPVPFLIQRGVYYNLQLLNILTKKGENVIQKALEYLMLMKKGTEQLALAGKPEFTYSQQDLKEAKADFKVFLAEKDNAEGVPTWLTNFDTELEHIIPEYKKILDSELFAPIEKRIVAGLGLIDVVEATSNSRRESILNPKPFIAEINRGISDFKSLLEDLFKVMVERNGGHKKYFTKNKNINICSSPVSTFMTADIMNQIRSMYDRGSISIKTYTELFGLDFDLEVKRRKYEEENDVDELMYPHVIQNQEESENNEDKDKKDDEVSPDKEGPEAKNFKNASVEDLESSKVVKEKDGSHVISEKTGKNLGGSYKTKKEAVERLRQVEYYKNKS